MLTYNENTHSTSPSFSEDEQVKKEQVYLLYKSSLKAAVATIAAAFFLAYVQLEHFPLSTIIIWLVAMSCVLSLRIYYYFAFKKAQPSMRHIRYWQHAYVLLTVIAGLVWGSAGIFLFPEGEFQYQAATVIVLSGMAAGAITTLSALRETALPFLFLIMTPVTIHLYFDGSSLAVIFSFLCVVYTLFLASASLAAHKTLRENIIFRIASKSREQTLKVSQQSLQKTADILEMVAKGLPATEVYDAIVFMYESRHVGLRCSLLELNKSTLKHGSAPNLPQAYCEAIDGLEIGPNVGSCGASTYTGKRVIVENIETDPKWADFKALALSFDLQSCWSEPIKDAHGKVLGSFAMYSDHPALPSDQELADLEAAAQLAGIVMEREQREHLLEKLHSAFEYAEEAISIATLEAEMEYVNPAFEAMSGYSAQELIGQYGSILRNPAITDDFYINMMNTLKQGKVWRGELSIKRKDGSLLEVERSVSPILDKDGTPLFHILIQRDISKQKEMEDKFHQAQKMEAIGTLVGGIAHDFNNILAGITGNVYLAKEKVRGNAEALEKITRIEQLSGYATKLIKQLLTFSRKDTVHMEATSLTELVKEVFTLLRTSIPENIDMQCNTSNHDIQILGDTTQMHQILLNLINNSRDALSGCPQPLITIHLNIFDAGAAEIQNHVYFKPQKYAHLSVSDNGTGIPASALEHLFEPFYTTKEVGKGTGLGLAMVFGAVKRHHGHIEVSSTEGSGSSFDIYFPLLKNQSSSLSADEIEQGFISGNREIILLVDDNEEVLEMSTELLESLDYQVLQATNGFEAVEVFKDNQHNISLVITDIVMPKMGGAEAVAEMRKINPNTQAVFTTGYDQDTARTKSLIHENDTILSKPYDIEELSQLIQQKLNSAKT